MLTWIFGLVFTSFILLIYAHDPVVYQLDESIVDTEGKAEYYLAEIQPVEALPLILFEKPTSPSDRNPFDFPETIDTVLIFRNPKGDRTSVDNKMLYGTSFSTANSNEPMFFCPKQNSSEICLAPQDFAALYRLVCPVSPIPTVAKTDEVPCGNHQSTRTYSMGYGICEAPRRPEKALAAVYYLCYDTVNQKNLYTSHYILSPRLLDSYLLLRERKLKFPLMVDPFVPTANEYVILSYSLFWNAWEANPSTTQPLYRVQMLAPSNDFALGSWIKTTYQYVNMELQHESLYHFWNDVVDLVERQAIKAYKNDIEFYIRTGVFDLELDANVLPKDGQKYNMWVKVVTSTSRITSDTLKGVVFMANNFTAPANSRRQKKIRDYCEESLCARHFMLKTGNKVRCCKMNDAIAQLFGPSVIRSNMEMLEINGLNETEEV